MKNGGVSKPARPHRKGVDASKVQSLLFSKTEHARGEKPWTKRSARAWAKAHKFASDTLEDTKNFYRFQQFKADKDRYDYRVISFGKSGIKATIAFPKRIAAHLPARFRIIEGGAPQHVLREVAQQMVLPRRRAA